MNGDERGLEQGPFFFRVLRVFRGSRAFSTTEHTEHTYPEWRRTESSGSWRVLLKLQQLVQPIMASVF